MDYSKLMKIDSDAMIQSMRLFPEQFSEAIEIANKWKPQKSLKKKYSGIIIQGMGGSGLGGMIVKSLLEKESKIPIIVNNNYSLPAFVNKNWLAVTVSYSGNTEETLSAFREAKKKKMNVIGISSNGALSKKCTNCIMVPAGFPPRTMLGMLFVPILNSLGKLGLTKKHRNLNKTAAFLEHNSEEAEEKGKKLAEYLKGNIPIIYAQEKYLAAAKRFHDQLAENSKAFSHYAVLPELNHNEIVGMKPSEKKLAFVFLRDKSENAKERKRAKFTEKIVKKKSKVKEVWYKGKDRMQKLFYCVMLGDFTSYYLALLYHEDPTPVKNIDRLKKELKK